MARAEIVHQNFRRRVAAGDLPEGARPAGPLNATDAVAIYRAGCLSRALDRTSRAMQRAGQGFYTIGSSGHEGMAAVAAALRVGDPAFLEGHGVRNRRHDPPARSAAARFASACSGWSSSTKHRIRRGVVPSASR